MKRMVLLLVFLSLSATISVAQVAPPNTQGKEPASAKPVTLPLTVDQILEKYVQAVGGKEALDKITSRTGKGSYHLGGDLNLSGEFESYSKSPNKNLIKVTLPGLGLFQEAYDGSVGWTNDPISGLRDRKGLEFEGARLDAEFNRELSLKRLYPKLELKGTQKVGDRDAYLIVGTPAAGSSENFYFDTQSGLLVRLDRKRVSAQGDVVAWEIYYEDYREVDGIKFPFTERQVSPGLTVTIKYTSLKHNLPIDDAKFAKPPK